MTGLLLYSTLGCHLCDEAQRVVVAAIGTTVPEKDIVDDDDLYERYSLRIPVLVRADDGRELNWPFDAAAVQQLQEPSR